MTILAIPGKKVEVPYCLGRYFEKGRNRAKDQKVTFCRFFCTFRDSVTFTTSAIPSLWDQLLRPYDLGAPCLGRVHNEQESPESPETPLSPLLSLLGVTQE